MNQSASGNKFVIFGLPRSGTNLLSMCCRVLANAEVLNEPFTLHFKRAHRFNLGWMHAALDLSKCSCGNCIWCGIRCQVNYGQGSFGIKETSSFMESEFLFDSLGISKRIIIHREIESIYRSFNKHGLTKLWSSQKQSIDLEKWINIQKNNLQKIANNTNSLSITYEDLCRSPFTVLSKVAEYLEVKENKPTINRLASVISSKGVIGLHDVIPKKTTQNQKNIGAASEAPTLHGKLDTTIQVTPVTVNNYINFLNKYGHLEESDWPQFLNHMHPYSNIRFDRYWKPKTGTDSLPVTNITQKGANYYAKETGNDLVDMHTWGVLNEVRIGRGNSNTHLKHSDSATIADLLNSMEFWGRESYRFWGNAYGIPQNTPLEYVKTPFSRRRLANMSSPSIGILCIRKI